MNIGKPNHGERRCRTGVLALVASAFAATLLLAAPDCVHASAVLDSVRVVPNPYNVSGRTYGPRNEPAGYERIRFSNLPLPNPNQPTLIKIYSMTLDLVATIEHNQRQEAYDWDGRNADNQYIVSGVYYYVIEHPDHGRTIGKFVVIR